MMRGALFVGVCLFFNQLRGNPIQCFLDWLPLPSFSYGPELCTLKLFSFPFYSIIFIIIFRKLFGPQQPFFFTLSDSFPTYIFAYLMMLNFFCLSLSFRSRRRHFSAFVRQQFKQTPIDKDLPERNASGFIKLYASSILERRLPNGCPQFSDTR